MDSTCRTKTVQAICKQIDKGTISFRHPLQRPEGQWNNKMKSDLIDSLLRKIPVNPSYGEKRDGVISIIDGIQRLSIVHGYVNNGFAIRKDAPVVFVNGEEKEIAGKRFSKLDEDTQDALLNSELQIYELTDCTENDICEMFKRQNAGKPLNQKLLRVIYEKPEFRNMIAEMIEHPFIKKIATPAQHRNGSDRDWILQTFMLILTDNDNDNDFTSFRTDNINTFVIEHQDEAMKYAGMLNDALDKFDKKFENKIKIPLTTIPMVLYSGYRVIKNHASFDKLCNSITKFIAEFDTNEEYKKSTNDGTSSSNNVTFRFNYWKNIVKSC